MKLRQLDYGATDTIALRLKGGNASDREIKVGDEATLRVSRVNGRVMLRVGTDVWWAEGAEPAQQDLLDLVVDTDLPCLTWVAQAGPDCAVAVQVHRFAHRLPWDQEIVVGMDEDSLRSAQRLLAGRRSADQLARWLADQFLLKHEPPDTAPARMLASAGPQAMTLDKGFRLHGTRAIAHIDNRDGRLFLKTLRRAGRRQREVMGLTLVEADVSFQDATSAHVFREKHRDEFARLLSTGQQYLNHWDDYSGRDRQQIAQRALALGAARYMRCARPGAGPSASTSTRTAARSSWPVSARSTLSSRQPGRRPPDCARAPWNSMTTPATPSSPAKSRRSARQPARSRCGCPKTGKPSRHHPTGICISAWRVTGRGSSASAGPAA